MRRTCRQIIVFGGDADQLQTLCRGLTLGGFACRAAPTPAAALEHLRAPAGERPDLLLADLTAPHRDDVRLVERARGLRPGLPVLVLAGLILSRDVLALRACGVPILPKPFTAEQLGRAIEAAIADAERA